MPDYADWTESIELLGTEIQVPIDIQGAFIQVPIDIQGQYVTLEMDIVAQSVGNIGIDIKAQSIGNISVNIAASAVTMNVAIQSSAVTLNVNIAASAVTMNVNISSQTANINVNIAASAVTMNINIAAQSGNVTIEVKAQTVAIKTQGEWSPQAGQQKYFQTEASNVTPSTVTYVAYAVTAGKTLYITHLGFAVEAYDLANYDHSISGWADIYNITTSTTLAKVGGFGGNSIVFPTPLRVPESQTIRIRVRNTANVNLNVYVCAAGYEI